MTNFNITITHITNATYETSQILDTRLGLVNCTQKVVVEKHGKVANCYVSFSLTDGTEFYTYESLDFARHLDRVKKFSLSLLANEIINRAEELMAA